MSLRRARRLFFFTRMCAGVPLSVTAVLPSGRALAAIGGRPGVSGRLVANGTEFRARKVRVRRWPA